MATKTVVKRTKYTVISGDDLASEITRKRYVPRTVDQWHALFNKKYQDNHTPENKDGQPHRLANTSFGVVTALFFVVSVVCMVNWVPLRDQGFTPTVATWFILQAASILFFLFTLRQWMEYDYKHSDMYVKSTDCVSVNPMKKWHHPISLYRKINGHSFDTDNYVWELFGEYNDLFVSYVELKEPSQHTAPVYIQAMESKEKEIHSIIDDYEEYLLDEDKQRAELLKNTLGVQELSS